MKFVKVDVIAIEQVEYGEFCTALTGYCGIQGRGKLAFADLFVTASSLPVRGRHGGAVEDSDSDPDLVVTCHMSHARLE